MGKSINRRSVKKATGAIIGTGAIAVTTKAIAGEVNPNAKLIALGEELEKQYKIYLNGAEDCIKASNADLDVTEIEDSLDVQYDIFAAIEDEIEKIPAQTLAGVIIKMEI